MSDSLWPHGLQHARLLCPPLSPGVCSDSCPLSQWCYLCPWNFPGKNTGVGHHFLFILFLGRTDGCSWSSNTLATWCKELTHLKRPWCWERLRVGAEGYDRGWDGWMAPLTQWTWVWANSRRWWRTEKPGCAAVHGITKSQTWLSDWTELNTKKTPIKWGLKNSKTPGCLNFWVNN